MVFPYYLPLLWYGIYIFFFGSGTPRTKLDFDKVSEFVTNIHDSLSPKVVHYVDYVYSNKLAKYPTQQSYIYAQISLPVLATLVTRTVFTVITCLYDYLAIGTHVTKAHLPQAVADHDCPKCQEFVVIFKSDQVPSQLLSDNITYPPEPLSQDLVDNIITGFCQSMSPFNVEESGCVFCGKLYLNSDMQSLKSFIRLFDIFKVPKLLRKERHSSLDPIEYSSGPVLDSDCNKICPECRRSLLKGKVPKLALANNLWLGKVPKVLQDLTFVEKLLVSRIRSNSCIVRISSGFRKMISHVVTFEAPTARVYHKLPPPREDLDEVLAIYFTGPTKPTENDFKRTPLLVRRNFVINALNWLKLNHSDYVDIEISQENMNQYSENQPPVEVDYKKSDTNKVPETTDLTNHKEENGVDSGDCPFVVHNLTGEKLMILTTEAQKSLAIKHLNSQGKILVVGHSANLESMYYNPQLYPQMFPWLFPYGSGGIGSTKLSDKEHKRHLLMYHDKRFQADLQFPFVVFSHQQIKASILYLVPLDTW
ncbi:hypothetical protein AX16_007370 [Volvariella volvacea WC 439]|nr:hypothetical protein AX16_007370 [Volvariella volvacea WC 439]